MASENESAAAEAEASSGDEVQDFGAEWDKASDADNGETGTDDEGAEGSEESEGGEGEGEGSEGSEGDESSEGDGEEAESDEAAKLAEQQQKASDWRESVAKAHPDLDTHVGTPKFNAWLDKQPKEVQNAASQIDDAAASAGVLTRYKADLAAGNVDEPSESSAVDAEQWFKDHGLGDAVMEVAGEDGEARQIGYAEAIAEYPGMKMNFDAMQAGLSELEKRLTEQFSQAIGGIDVDKINSGLGDFALLRAHPDADKVSKTKQFNDYLGKQAAPLKRLWTNGDAESRIAFMGKYKSETSRRGSGRTDQSAALHASTMSGSSDGHDAAEGGGGGGESFDGAWEAAKKKDK